MNTNEQGKAVLYAGDSLGLILRQSFKRTRRYKDWDPVDDFGTVSRERNEGGYN